MGILLRKVSGLETTEIIRNPGNVVVADVVELAMYVGNIIIR